VGAIVAVAVAVAVGVGVGVLTGRTVVDAVAKLLPGKGSKKQHADTEAELPSGPASVGVTTKVTVTLLKAGMAPRSQSIPPVTLLQLP
jgi:hypothetical protein